MMAVKFNYRFQNILKIKEKIEESKKYQLASTQQHFRKEKGKLDSLLEKKRQNIDKWNAITNDNKVVKIKELQNSSTRLQMVNDLIERQENVVKKCETKLNHHRNELIEAQKQTKIFEKIKEKDFEVFQIQQDKDEAALIDQLVTYKSTINKGG